MFSIFLLGYPPICGLFNITIVGVIMVLEPSIFHDDAGAEPVDIYSPLSISSTYIINPYRFIILIN
jgi:hypothetical protein